MINANDESVKGLIAEFQCKGCSEKGTLLLSRRSNEES